MNFAERAEILRKLSALRGGRAAVSFLNFDRASDPRMPGLAQGFAADAKEALYRTLKETDVTKGIDLFLYTRGGDVNAVWPIVSLLREFDTGFEILVPFRCHSSGTLVALGAKKIILTTLSELSPIDPTTANQFNPPDPQTPNGKLPIAVEDVQQYLAYVAKQVGLESSNHELVRDFVHKLVDRVHPLALGNVHRVLQQIKQLAIALLKTGGNGGPDPDKVVEHLTSRFFSHLHAINRHEAKDLLGAEHVEFASADLERCMDELLYAYEKTFELRLPFMTPAWLGTDLEKDARFIGGVIESHAWSYLYETKALISQRSQIPPNVEVQLQPNARLPLVRGLPVELTVEVRSQAWVRNKQPVGVTV